jgi:ribosomal protein L37AE/L43A
MHSVVRMDICTECRQGELIHIPIEEQPNLWKCNGCNESFRKVGPHRYVKLED